MLGAIAGDVIGSRFEWKNLKSKEFDLFTDKSEFTDDSVLTIALADSFLRGEDYGFLLKEYYQKYPDKGYGGGFIEWASSEESEPYNSWGNGSAMRISPVGWVAQNLKEVDKLAEEATVITHNHPEGVRGAKATATAVFLARKGYTKENIAECMTEVYGYELILTCDEIRPFYTYHVSCQNTVPQAIQAFLEAESFEDAIRNAVSLGGDSDTLACITGSIAEAFYGVPLEIRLEIMKRLTPDLQDVVMRFNGKYMAGAYV